MIRSYHSKIHRCKPILKESKNCSKFNIYFIFAYERSSGSGILRLSFRPLGDKSSLSSLCLSELLSRKSEPKYCILYLLTFSYVDSIVQESNCSNLIFDIIVVCFQCINQLIIVGYFQYL